LNQPIFETTTLREVAMWHFTWLLDPGNFMTHLLHFKSADPAVARGSTPISAVDSNATLCSAANRDREGRRCEDPRVDARLDYEYDYEPPFVEEMVMDLP
jgi:hypothetical protein